jgi:hypothetical protein
MAEEKQSRVEQFLDWVRENHEKQPSVWAEMRALGREAAKDTADTLNRVFFGQPGGMREPGTPLVPTQAMVTKDLGTVHGYQSMLEDAAARTATDKPPERGMDR